MTVTPTDARSRAAASRGASSDVLYGRAREILLARQASGHVADVGCGAGGLHGALGGIATRYTGMDLLRYDAFPPGLEFAQVDLDCDALPLPDRSVDVTVALETIEHLENPRRFVRELARITRRGGAILVSTPNQLSVLSLLTLLARGEFNAFQAGDYPAHRTALLPIDLQRIAAECGLQDIEVAWSHSGRLPLSGARVPGWISRMFPSALSDNVLMVARVSP
jgi:2-polyprenyl-3-methyl-5-hydroxy-6-metoxy-1,4-benzoquinol methylase